MARRATLIVPGMQSHLADPSWDGSFEPRRLPAMSMDMGGRRFPDATPDEAERLARRDAGSLKMVGGGFWTSTADASGRSDWERWLEANPTPRHENEAVRHLYDTDPHARVLMVRDAGDVLEFLGRESDETLNRLDVATFWHEAAGCLDAVNIARGHDHESDLLHAFDVECTVWFRPERHLIPVESVRLVRVPGRTGYGEDSWPFQEAGTVEAPGAPGMG